MKFHLTLVLGLALTLSACSLQGADEPAAPAPEPTPDVTIDFLGEELEIPGESVDKTNEAALQLEF